MEKFLIKAIANKERGLEEQTKTIYAESLKEAEKKALKLFKEYRELTVCENKKGGLK